MNKTKLTQSFKINSISSVIMIAVFSIIFLVFFAFRGRTGDWPLEIWGIVAIFISMIYSFAYQILGGFATDIDEVKS